MKMLDRLERIFGRFAVPNVIMPLIIAQVFVYGMVLIGKIDYNLLLLVPEAILEGGEFWRLVTFIIAPPFVAISLPSALFLAFFWYVLSMMSSHLEEEWGVFRFNVYLVCGIFSTVVTALLGQIISPTLMLYVSPQFLYLSIFFAFATLYPNVEFRLMLILPVKVKWLALFAAAFTLIGFIFAPTIGARLVILGPVLNYFLFFGREFVGAAKSRKRRKAFKAERKKVDSSAFHICSVCGDTDKSAPDKAFRYRKVEGDMLCYCESCK